MPVQPYHNGNAETNRLSQHMQSANDQILLQIPYTEARDTVRF